MLIKPLIFYFAVRKFVCVHREAQQIFMGVNAEYRANLVKARVNVPITCFTYTGSVSISYFEYQKAAGRGLLNLQNLHWNVIGVIINKFPTAIPCLVVLY